MKQLNLPSDYEERISEAIYKDRMLFEPWIESAESYRHLVKELKKRGFRNLPASGKPALWSSDMSKERRSYALDQNMLDKITKNKIMAKRNSKKFRTS